MLRCNTRPTSARCPARKRVVGYSAAKRTTAQKKSEDVVDELLVAVRDGQQHKIMALIDKLDKPSAPARSDFIAGKWRLKWIKLSEEANFLQKALAKQVDNWQTFRTDEAGNTTVENQVGLPIGTVRVKGTCTTDSDTRTSITFERAVLEILGREFLGPDRSNPVGCIDWIYVDERIRVAQGNRGSVFLSTRETDE